MRPRLVDHLTFPLRLARDRWRERAGDYPFRAGDYPTRYLGQATVALSCDAFGGVPYVMYGIEGRPELVDWARYRNLPAGACVWLRIEDLAEFNQRVLPGIAEPFVLVTGESDYTVPSDFPDAADTLVRSGKVARWFSTNCDRRAYPDVLTAMPLGLNYAKKNELHLYGGFARRGVTRVDMKSPRVQEDEWDAIVGAARPVSDRIPTAIADFHLNDSSRARRYGESRTDICRQLHGNPRVTWLARRGSLAWLLATYAQYAFVVSPHGRALDCYRTWEALLAGSIPIVKTSAVDDLYRGLPVVVVEDWREITARNLASWLDRFGSAFDRTPVSRTLSAAHWVSRIRAAAASVRR